MGFKVIMKKKVNSLYNTLNDKQKAYVNLNLENLNNGKYLLTVFHLVPGKNSRVRIHKSRVIYYCFNCKKYMRFLKR